MPVAMSTHRSLFAVFSPSTMKVINRLMATPRLPNLIRPPVQRSPDMTPLFLSAVSRALIVTSSNTLSAVRVLLVTVPVLARLLIRVRISIRLATTGPEIRRPKLSRVTSLCIIRLSGRLTDPGPARLSIRSIPSLLPVAANERPLRVTRGRVVSSPLRLVPIRALLVLSSPSLGMGRLVLVVVVVVLLHGRSPARQTRISDSADGTLRPPTS